MRFVNDERQHEESFIGGSPSLELAPLPSSLREAEASGFVGAGHNPSSATSTTQRGDTLQADRPPNTHRYQTSTTQSTPPVQQSPYTPDESIPRSSTPRRPPSIDGDDLGGPVVIFPRPPIAAAFPERLSSRMRPAGSDLSVEPLLSFSQYSSSADLASRTSSTISLGPLCDHAPFEHFPQLSVPQRRSLAAPFPLQHASPSGPRSSSLMHPPRTTDRYVGRIGSQHPAAALGHSVVYANATSSSTPPKSTPIQSSPPAAILNLRPRVRHPSRSLAQWGSIPDLGSSVGDMEYCVSQTVTLQRVTRAACEHFGLEFVQVHCDNGLVIASDGDLHNWLEREKTRGQRRVILDVQ